MYRALAILLAFCYFPEVNAGQYLNVKPHASHDAEGFDQGLGTFGYGMNNQNYPSYLYPRGPYSGYGPSNGYYPYSNFPNYPYYAY